MKVLFTVFSASGNTARVCRLFSERLKERGAECETVRIREDMKTPDYAAADVLVIGYPVHGFNAPQNVVVKMWLISQRACQNAKIKFIIL